MFSLFWKLMPGGPFFKTFFTMLYIIALAALLWFVVFPWANPYLPFDDVTVGQAGQGSGSAEAPSAGPSGGTSAAPSAGPSGDSPALGAE